MHPQAKKIAELIGDKVIVVIEPTPNYRASIKQFLANLRLKNVRVVSSTAEAKREMLVNTGRIGAFIVEWRQGEENGLQFCRNLRQTPGYRDIPFVLTSVENLKNDVVLASEVGVTGYLLKPFSYEDFCDHLFMVIQQRHEPSPVNQLLDEADKRLAERQYDAARKMYLDASNMKPDSARAITGLAKVAGGKGHHKEALALVHEAIKLNPTYVEAHRVMLHIYHVLNDTTGVKRAALVLHQMSPDNPKYTLMLAKADLELGNFEPSEEFFRKTIRISPKLAEAYKGLGNLYMTKQDYDNAMKNYSKALDLDKDDISVLNSFGLAFVKQGKMKEGVQKYLMALKLDPQNIRVLFNIGYASEKLGDVEKAKLYYHKAVSIDPHFRKAKRRLGFIAQGLAGKEDEEDQPGRKVG